MRVERAQAKKGPNGGLLGAVMGLVFVAGFFLSLVAPKELDTPFIDVGKPEAAGLVSPSPDNTPPAETIAKNDSLDESNSLDLQLD